MTDEEFNAAIVKAHENGYADGAKHGEKKGRYLERQRCARVIEDFIKAYPEKLFPDGKYAGREANIGTGLRTMLPVVLKDIKDQSRLRD